MGRGRKRRRKRVEERSKGQRRERGERRGKRGRGERGERRGERGEGRIVAYCRRAAHLTIMLAFALGRRRRMGQRERGDKDEEAG